jgi:hypothetical protein
LHRAFDARIAVNSEEHMEVVRHYHELVQFELAGQGIRPKHVNKKFSFVLRLKKETAHVGLRPGEKRPHPATIFLRSDFRVSFTIRSG